MIRARPFLSLALVALGTPTAAAQTPADPRAMVRTALRAVEGDSADALRARWGARLQADWADRLATLGLATLDRLTYDYPAAARRYALLYADSARPDPIAVYARLGAGQALDTRGQLTAASEQLELARVAARSAGDRRAEGEALLPLSFLRAQARGVAVGFATLDTVDRLLPDSVSDLRAELLRRRAGLSAIVGRADSAALFTADCLRVSRAVGEPRIEATCLRAQAYSLSAQGMEDSASAILREVARLQRRARDHGGLATTLLFATDPYLDRGAYGTAKVMLEQALVEAGIAQDEAATAAVHLGLGSLALRFADYVTADAELGQAARMFSAQGSTNDAVNAVAFQAYLAGATGDLDRAREQYARVIDWDRKIGNVRAEFDARMQAAEIEMLARDWPAAGVALDSARRLARRTRRPLWLSELGYEEGRLAMARGDLAGAERRLMVYLQSRDSTERLQRHLARTRLAEVYARRGEVARAEQELTAAGEELDRWRDGLADAELRLLAFQASAGDHRSRDASLARVLATLVDAGRVKPAFELAERRRARELVDRLARTEALQVDTSAGSAGRDVPRAGAITADAASAALSDDRTALVEYVTGVDGAPTTVFLVTRAGIQARVLPAADSVLPSIERFVAMLEQGEDPRGPGGRLGPALLGSVLPLLPLGVDRLLVVPDGPLHRLPFDALRLDDGRYLMERYTVAVVPSAAALAALRQRPPRQASSGAEAGTLLALGDPAFAHERSALPGGIERYRDAFDRSGGLPRLTGAGDEVRDVARYARSPVVRTRAEASEAFLKREPLRHYGVLHFATHALVDEATLARTALALAPGEGEDGFVSPADLGALQLDADLVVLSACRTAGGMLVAGEGLQGLTGPLLKAGARSVVATQWRVGDRSTVRLVDGFYHAMAAGRPVADALREAKLAALRRGAPARDWAGFTVVGDPEVRVALERPQAAERVRQWWPAGAALLVLVAGSAAIATRRRRSVRPPPRPGTSQP